MKKKWGFATTLAAIVFFLLIVPFGNLKSMRVQLVSPSDTIVLDAGHGGIDGGAVSMSGVMEKDINLAIAQEISNLASADGWHVIMTRDKDKGLYSDVVGDGTKPVEIKNKRSIRSLKTEDLKERVKIIEKEKPLLAVSIHLNSFKEDRSVHGAQTFYPKGVDEKIEEESKHLAECIQEAIIQGVQDGTERAALGKKDVLLFKKPTVPTVIVECGFLSNHEEEKKLQDLEYQKKVAKYIYEGIMKYTGREKKTNLKILDNRG